MSYITSGPFVKQAKESPFEEEGDGFLQDLKKKITGNYSGEADFKKFLNKFGNTVIKSITIYREPVNKVLKEVLNLINLGKFKKQTQKLGYDTLFHISMVINDYISVEKNSVVKTSEGSRKYALDVQKIEVPFIPPNLTIGKAFENEIAKLGPEHFYVYDAYAQNCQGFLQGFLNANGMLTPDLRAFINQDAVQILRGLPAYSGFASNIITDLGSFFKA